MSESAERVRPFAHGFEAVVGGSAFERVPACDGAADSVRLGDAARFGAALFWFSHIVVTAVGVLVASQVEMTDAPVHDFGHIAVHGLAALSEFAGGNLASQTQIVLV